MEFEEKFTSPFTTPTTCYSCGSKRVVDWGSHDEDARYTAPSEGCASTIQFATESHILGVNLAKDTATTGETSDPIDTKTSCRSLPRDSAQLTCVGYSHWDVEETTPATDTRTEGNYLSEPAAEGSRKPDSTTFHHIEALALIDPDLVEDHLLSDPDSSPLTMNLHRPPPIVIEKDDIASMATPHSRQSAPPQHRVVTSTSASSIHSGGTTGNPSLSSGLVGYHRKSHSELSKGSHTTTSDAQQSASNTHVTPNPTSDIDNGNETGKNRTRSRLLQKSRGRLVLRHDRFEICRKSSADPEGGGGRSLGRQWHESSFALLDFRPLCPCLARWGKGQSPTGNQHADSGDHENGFVGMWVGSADDATLRLFVPSASDPRSLVSVALPEDHFSVESPVMALDFCSVRWHDHHSSQLGGTPTITTHTLAVGCQDGTIQLITWKDRSEPNDSDKANKTNATTSSLFGDIISSQRVIVDGPLVCLKLDYNRFASLRVIVGSLCGYVCQLTYDHQGSGGDSWEGPFMIVQHLFNASIHTEESILAVGILDNYVAIGTQLGRCLLYATHDSENYFPVWQVALPYPVHGIEVIDRTEAPEKEGDIALSIAVTTRRSFHLFDATRGRVPWRQKPRKERYSPELARMRLSKILDEIRKENNESDRAARTVVLETLQDLVTSVEHNVREPDTDVGHDSSSAGRETVGVIVSGAIDDLIDRVMEHTSVERKPLSHTTDSEDRDAPDEKASGDPPHWEYSSSDEEESLEPAKNNNTHAEEAHCPPTDQKAVDED